MEKIGTTPFGGGRMTARLFIRQAEVAERQEKLRAGDGGNDAGMADKWQLLRALTEAASVYGLSDRAICLLEALLSFAPERALDGREPIIVFPSNRELSLRARGMAPATIRRHLAALIEAGMIFRRDSANGKRFCRRDEKGAVEDAFGFDLAPLALRAGEIHASAEAARAEARAIRTLRGEVTLHQRDIGKIIASALQEGRAGDWPGMAERFGLLLIGLPRNAGVLDLTSRREALIAMRREVENAYLDALSEEEMSGKDCEFERHHQTSKTEQTFESSSYDPNTQAAEAGPEPQNSRKLALSLSRLKRLCPQIIDYAKDGIASWPDLMRTAELVRSMLGISPDAWRKAKAAMGEEAASVVIAVMLERAEHIRSPGGYLRDLTAKAEKGSFSIFPMLQALERKRE